MAAIIAALVIRVMRQSSIAVAVVTRSGWSKKVTGPEKADDYLLAPLRNDAEFDLSLQDIKNCVGNVTLRKSNLILPIFRCCFSPAHFGEKVLGVKRSPASVPQNGSAFSSPVLSRMKSHEVAASAITFTIAAPPFRQQ
jgi:hypothetical protein